MADESITVINNSGNSGTDYDVAVDTVASKQYQRVKIDLGADGVASPLAAGQTTASGSVPVVLSSDENDVTVTSSALPTGASTAALQTTGNTSLSTIAGDTTSLDGKVTACDTGNVTVASSALPTGAATAANQSTGNSSLSTIAGAVAAEGAALGSGVLLQGDDGTDRKNLNVDPTTGDLQVDVTNNIGISGTVATTQSGTWNINNVSGTVSLPTGAATAANQSTANSSLATIAADTTSIDGAFAAEGSPLGNGLLLQGDDGTDRKNLNVDPTTGDLQVDVTNSVTVSGTVAATQSGTWNVNDVSGTVSLPTGAATSALQTTGNTSLSTIAGDTTSLDSKITACNTGAVTVSSSALPTGAATAANQSTANTSLSTIAGDTTSLDTKITTCDTDDVRQTTASNLNAQAVGNVADNAADSGNPVKVGTVYNSTEQTYGSGDRADLQSDSAGYLHTSVRRSSTTTLVSAQTYNNTTTTTTSSSVDCRKFRTGFLSYELTESGSATDIKLQLQGSFDDSDFQNFGDSFLNHLIFDDATIAAATSLEEVVRVENLPPYIRLVVTATGTDASNTFTLTSKWSMMD